MSFKLILTPINMKNDAGKGDTYRPTDRKKYDANYIVVFGVKRPTWISQEEWDKLSEQEKKEIVV